MDQSFEILECLNGNTLKDPVTGQPMHSAIGPDPEAQQIYLGPSGFSDLLELQSSFQGSSEPSSKPLILWDVGMGIAANAIEALKTTLKKSKEAHGKIRHLEIHSFENATHGLRTALAQSHRFGHLIDFEELCSTLLSQGHASLEEHQWRLHEGDFRQTLKNAPPADVIFYDFYSPRACGELWSVPLMQAVLAQSPRAVLATYSAATPVRLALLLAGWWVGKPSGSVPVTSLKNESTLACGEPTLLPRHATLLGESWLLKFRSSTQAQPYGDEKDPWAKASFELLEEKIKSHPQFRS
ncbi:MAG: MnmC family methyltransferase [Oligoflexia bacterium]